MNARIKYLNAFDMRFKCLILFMQTKLQQAD